MANKIPLRFFIFGLVVILAGISANHIEGASRQKNNRNAAEAGNVTVRAERNAAGHNQIGIDEASVRGGEERSALTFAQLIRWEYERDKATPCPEEIQHLSGRTASCTGFMYPLEPGSALRVFCLLRTTQTCCYGPRPQYNQYLFVEAKSPVKFERFAPVTVEGKFFVDAQPEQGYIYRMEATSVASAAGDEPDVPAAEVARREHSPLFDFAPLDEMEKQKPAVAVPTALKNLDGRVAVVDGFVVKRLDDSAPRLIIGKNAWDGKSIGVRPTMFNTVTVVLRDRTELPPVWKQHGVFIGTLRVSDPLSWPDGGIMNLTDAVRADVSPGFRKAGLRISVPVEAGVLVVYLVAAFAWGMRKRTGSLEASA
jgi:hypothetical protein